MVQAANRRLRRRGFRPAAPPIRFFVGGTKGPLLDGEIDRARAWGAELGAVPATGAAACSEGRSLQVHDGERHRPEVPSAGDG